MSDTRLSACKYCGQTTMVEAQTEAKALHMATMQCDCDEAMRYKDMHRKAEEAVEKMEALYSDESVPEEIIDLMKQNIDLMRDGVLAEAQYKLRNGKKLKVKYSGYSYTIECSKADKKKVDG